ncbi:MAG: hypothetical protein ABI347_09565 [Nitrososphaera sp.]
MNYCSQEFIDLTYKDDGWMMIAIDDEKPDDGRCSMTSRTHSDTIKELDCGVPAGRLASWNAWKDPYGPDVSEIDEHCKIISSFKGSVEPAQ